MFSNIFVLFNLLFVTKLHEGGTCGLELVLEF